MEPKVDALIDVHVSLRGQIILFQNILEDHLGHAALSSAQHGAAAQIRPLKVFHGFPGYKKITGPLGELGKVYDVIAGILAVDVDGGL